MGTFNAGINHYAYSRPTPTVVERSRKQVDGSLNELYQNRKGFPNLLILFPQGHGFMLRRFTFSSPASMTLRSPPSWNSIFTCRLKRQAPLRYLSTPAKNAVHNKAFTDTLLLPKTPFPLRADLKENEVRYGELTRENLYKWQVCTISV